MKIIKLFLNGTAILAIIVPTIVYSMQGNELVECHCEGGVWIPDQPNISQISINGQLTYPCPLGVPSFYNEESDMGNESELGEVIDVGYEYEPGKVCCPRNLEWIVPARIQEVCSNACVRQFLVHRQRSDAIHCAASCVANAIGIESAALTPRDITPQEVIAKAPYKYEEICQNYCERHGDTTGLSLSEQFDLAHSYITEDTYVIVANLGQGLRIYKKDPSHRGCVIDSTDEIAQYLRSQPTIVAHFLLSGAVPDHSSLLSLVKRAGEVPLLIYTEPTNHPISEIPQVNQYIQAVYNFCIR